MVIVLRRRKSKFQRTMTMFSTISWEAILVMVIIFYFPIRALGD